MAIVYSTIYVTVYPIEFRSFKQKTITLAYVITQYYGESAKTGWLEIRILCPSEVVFLPVDYSVSEQRVMV